jgi:hypothetical protein
MKIVFFFFIVVSSVFAMPTWYHNLPKAKQNTDIGYGSASSEKEAKQNALNSIVSQISTTIEHKTSIDKKMVAGNYQKDIAIKSTQQSKAKLYDYNLLKLEYKDREYFVAIEYENIPSLDKFVKKINDKSITKKTIINSIQKDFGNSLGFELVRKDKMWYIKYKNFMQILDKKDFSLFFKTIVNNSFDTKVIKPNKYIYENDEFYFEILSKKAGYMSILTVYEDGTVSTMMQNIKINANQKENLPDKDFEAIPEAGLLQKGVETYDMYIFILSDEKLLFDSFALAGDDVIKDDRYKNFDMLLAFLSDKNYSSLKVITKPR